MIQSIEARDLPVSAPPCWCWPCSSSLSTSAWTCCTRCSIRGSGWKRGVEAGRGAVVAPGAGRRSDRRGARAARGRRRRWCRSCGHRTAGAQDLDGACCHPPGCRGAGRLPARHRPERPRPAQPDHGRRRASLFVGLASVLVGGLIGAGPGPDRRLLRRLGRRADHAPGRHPAVAARGAARHRHPGGHRQRPAQRGTGARVRELGPIRAARARLNARRASPGVRPRRPRARRHPHRASWPATSCPTSPGRCWSWRPSTSPPISWPKRR